MPIDRIILTALYGVAVGFVLGWYIPKTVAAKFDPVVNRGGMRSDTRNKGASAVWKFHRG